MAICAHAAHAKITLPEREFNFLEHFFALHNSAPSCIRISRKTALANIINNKKKNKKIISKGARGTKMTND